MHRIRAAVAICVVSFTGPVAAIELPAWVQSVVVKQPSPSSAGAVTLSGDWLDTCVPDFVSHRVERGTILLDVEHPGINVGCGDAITPWSLTQPLPRDESQATQIEGTLFAVDPDDRERRSQIAGPDVLATLHPPRPGEFHGLGNRFAPTYVSAALDVSADGLVVVGRNEVPPGTSSFVTHEAFVWSRTTGMFGLGLLPQGVPGGSEALGVSADGNFVVGASTSQRDNEAFTWSLGSGLAGIGGFQETSITQAVATSRDGTFVVGSDEFYPPGEPDGPLSFFGRAFRWTEEGSFEDLGQVFGGGSSRAADVSASGQVVVGTSRPNPFIEVAFPDISEPFRWTPPSGMVGLGHLPVEIPDGVDPDVSLPIQRESKAHAVSAIGEHVVGSSRAFTPLVEAMANTIYPDGQFPERAFLWTPADGMTDLGQLVEATQVVSAEARDVSGHGMRVVGMTVASLSDAAVPPEPLPFVWDPHNGMRLLSDVLELDYGLSLVGWQLGEVTAISDDGTTIVGTGVNRRGDQEAWRAVLSHLSDPGDADFDGDVDGHDYLQWQRHFGATAEQQAVFWSYGDFNSDGRVGRADLELLLAHWNGAGPAPTGTIPEPSSGFLLLTAVPCFFHRRRARR